MQDNSDAIFWCGFHPDDRASPLPLLNNKLVRLAASRYTIRLSSYHRGGTTGPCKSFPEQGVRDSGHGCY